LDQIKLKNLREKLGQINKSFFQILTERKNVVDEIIKLKKNSLTLDQIYDPAQERNLFNEMKDELSKLTLEELLAFSLIMESQAGEHYPKFSKLEHWNFTSDLNMTLLSPTLLQLNPQLLFYYLGDKYLKFIKNLEPDFQLKPQYILKTKYSGQ
jgi:chorismate mutase